MSFSVSEQTKVVVVGLGYVGLPLTLAFDEHFLCTGFDTNAGRVEGLQRGVDFNHEVPSEVIQRSSAVFTDDPACIRDADLVVVTVPTPITEDYEPDLSLLESASKIIGSQLKDRSEGKNPAVVVFESTTYPGCTEDFCGPIIEQESGLVSGEGFYLGYSPERTNFGDQDHSLENVIKIISGQNAEAEQFIFDAYSRIAISGVHRAESIRVAESAKVIENIQRDLNIALFNELSMIFDKMDINSSAVFDAAATKWNFHRYRPGLVGGHCIPVDPYYLTHAAEQVGHDSKVVLAGRAVNEAMPEMILGKIRLLAESEGYSLEESSLLFLGATFKPDVTDMRNSKTFSLFKKIACLNPNAYLVEPNVDPSELDENAPHAISSDAAVEHDWDIVVVGVAHSNYSDELRNHVFGEDSDTKLVVDVPGMLNNQDNALSPYIYWRL